MHTHGSSQEKRNGGWRWRRKKTWTSDEFLPLDDEVKTIQSRSEYKMKFLKALQCYFPLAMLTPAEDSILQHLSHPLSSVPELIFIDRWKWDCVLDCITWYGGWGGYRKEKIRWTWSESSRLRHIFKSEINENDDI